jgi:hypothetical protein
MAATCARPPSSPCRGTASPAESVAASGTSRVSLRWAITGLSAAVRGRQTAHRVLEEMDATGDPGRHQRASRTGERARQVYGVEADAVAAPVPDRGPATRMRPLEEPEWIRDHAARSKSRNAAAVRHKRLRSLGAARPGGESKQQRGPAGVGLPDAAPLRSAPQGATAPSDEAREADPVVSRRWRLPCVGPERALRAQSDASRGRTPPTPAPDPTPQGGGERGPRSLRDPGEGGRTACRVDEGSPRGTHGGGEPSVSG